MAQTIVAGNLHVQGTVSAQAFNLSAGSVGNTDVEAAAGIDADKLEHQHSINVELFGPAVTVAALTKWLYACRGATGTVVAAQAAIAVQATGADRTVTVDIQKSTGGGAFATILTATINITNATVIRTAVTGTVGTGGALVAGDILQAVVTVAGAAGAQATGLLLTLTVREDAD